MLQKIKLKNFKCFKKWTTIPLNQLNLFTGINGRGKSTVLQSLLLMQQSCKFSKTTSQLIFNGDSLQLGNFNDVKNSAISKNERIEFVFEIKEKQNNVQLHYHFTDNEKDDMVADIEIVEIEGKYQGLGDYSGVILKHDEGYLYKSYGGLSPGNFKNFVPQQLDEGFIDFVQRVADFERIHYVSANRIGPQEFYLRQNFPEFPNTGSRGEYTAHILAMAKRKQETIPKELVTDHNAPNTVLDQTEAWMSKIFDGGKIDIKPVEANIVVMEMNSEDSPRMYKPLNIGFGYSYALPIIVSGLIARKGEILMVENPEAHLHPFAQSQLAKFLARVSRNGVQVFIESHSDHILNGLRVAVLDKILKNTDLNILYFQRDEDVQVNKVPVEPDGAINEWPPGFFDQADKDFERLFGV